MITQHQVLRKRTIKTRVYSSNSQESIVRVINEKPWLRNSDPSQLAKPTMVPSDAPKAEALPEYPLTYTDETRVEKNSLQHRGAIYRQKACSRCSSNQLRCWEARQDSLIPSSNSPGNRPPRTFEWRNLSSCNLVVKLAPLKPNHGTERCAKSERFAQSIHLYRRNSGWEKLTSQFVKKSETGGSCSSNYQESRRTYH